MSERWNGYLRADRNVANLNEENFATLIEAMQALGPQSISSEGANGQPVNVNHPRPNKEEDIDDPPVKYILQANFDPSEVTVENFKQMMADLFEQPVEDIGDTFEDVSYSGAGRETREWTFTFPAGVTERLTVARFGRGGSQADSNKEVKGYLKANPVEWGEEVA